MSAPLFSHFDLVSGQGETGPAGSVRVTRGANGLQVSVDGGAPSPVSGGGGTPGTNIAISGGVVSTVLTAFTQQVNSTDTAGVGYVVKKSRGTSGSPTVIVTGDSLGAESFQGYDGTAYTQGINVGVRSNGTIAGGSIPSDWYVYLGASTTPFSVGANTINLRLFSNGAVGVGFPASQTTTDFRGLSNDTAGLNILNSVGHVQNHISGWNINGSSVAVASWVEHGGFVVNTDANETTTQTREILVDGSFSIATVIQGIAGSGTASQFIVQGGTVGAPGYSTRGQTTSGFYSVASAGPNIDWRFAFAGIRAIDFAETGSGSDLTRIVRVLGNGNGDCGFEVNAGGTTGHLTGIFGDHTSGGGYIAAESSSIGVGAPGALATNATAGFLAMATCAGTPSGTPANMVSGKVAWVYDTTAHKIWAFDGGAWKATAALT
jgi:hypothetical protein